MSEIYTQDWKAYLLLLPTLVVSVAFLYYPAFKTFRLALYQTVAAGANRMYVGLDNFVWLLESPGYHYSFFISLVFAAVVVVGSMGIALYLSYLIYRVAVGTSGYLVSGILSYSFSFTIVATIMVFLLEPSVGILTNLIEQALGLEINWVTNSTQAILVVSGTSILKMVGYNVIFLIGALSSIPETINETAKLDGIGHFKLLSRVYVPLISPTLAFLLIMNTVYAFFLPFPVIDVMTSGGPGNSTSILIYHLYQTAFNQSQMGLAATESLVLFVLVGGLIVVQLVWSDRAAHFGGGT